MTSAAASSAIAIPLRQRMSGLAFARRWGSWIVALVLLLAWQAATMIWHIPVYILPQPLVLFATISENAGVLAPAWITTVLEAAIGFLVGNALSVAVAYLVWRFAALRPVVMPMAVAVKGAPKIAIVPLVTLAVGFGYPAVVVIVAIVCFFPTFVNVSRGLRAVPRGEAELMYVLNTSPLRTFFTLRLPYALPYLFSALRITVPAAFSAAMLGEYVAANGGLGYLIQDGYGQFQFLLVWQVVIIATVTSLAAYVAVTRAEAAILTRFGT